MNSDILNTIEVLTSRVSAKEEETNKLKKLVNELCAEAGIEIRFPNFSEVSGGIAAIRSDFFYGQPLTAAIRNYLELRKGANLGAASIAEIHAAIRDGGYKFEAKSDDIAKVSLANTLRKSSSVFHRLPNGKYGLLAWYPSAKAQGEPEGIKKTKRAVTAKNGHRANGNAVTNGEIRDTILAKENEFQAADILNDLKEQFPTKDVPKTKVPTVLFILKNKGLIRQVSPKVGSRPAIYTKA